MRAFRKRREPQPLNVYSSCTIPTGDYKSYEGSLEGYIDLTPQGTEGFGYDPVFVVPECNKTVAELDPRIKNKISHRGKAFEKLKKKLAIRPVIN